MSLIARIATSVSAYAVSSRNFASGACVARLREQLDPGHPRHPLVGDDQGDRSSAQRQLGEQRRAPRRPRWPHDPVVGAVPRAQVAVIAADTSGSSSTVRIVGLVIPAALRAIASATGEVRVLAGSVPRGAGRPRRCDPWHIDPRGPGGAFRIQAPRGLVLGDLNHTEVFMASTDAGVTGPTRARIEEKTLRTDRWWLYPAVTFVVFSAFVVYATWRAFIGARLLLGAVPLAVLLALPAATASRAPRTSASRSPGGRSRRR